MKIPTPRAGIEKIKLYTPGAAPETGKILRKLSSNENLYGPSPKAIEAVGMAAENLWKYPSVDHAPLREAISAVHDLPIAQIICGNGSDELLALLAQAYAGAGDEVIMTAHGFEIYGIVTHAVGARLVVVDERERVVDVDNILDAINENTRMIYIANPANPTGTILPSIELERLAASIPEHILLVIDSAYAEFAQGYDGGASIAQGQGNVVMTRTFSKLYGLGGLRIGWAFGSKPIIDTLNRIRGPFNLSSLALAGAEAAMRDQSYADICRAKILEDRKYMRDAFLQYGLGVDESAANFLLVRFGGEAEAEAARVFLAQKGFLVRSVAHYRLAEALRITIGTSEDNHAVVDLISEFMGNK